MERGAITDASGREKGIGGGGVHGESGESNIEGGAGGCQIEVGLRGR
jgi:hypothetical protein